MLCISVSTYSSVHAQNEQRGRDRGRVEVYEAQALLLQENATDTGFLPRWYTLIEGVQREFCVAALRCVSAVRKGLIRAAISTAGMQNTKRRPQIDEQEANGHSKGISGMRVLSLH